MKISHQKTNKVINPLSTGIEKKQQKLFQLLEIQISKFSQLLYSGIFLYNFRFLKQKQQQQVIDL